VAARIDVWMEDAASRGDTKNAAELAELASRYGRLADRRSGTQGEWATARWTPFLPHPYVEIDSPLRGIDDQ
jgi:hypothetical protein